MTLFEKNLSEKLEQLKNVQKTTLTHYLKNYVNTLGLTEAQADLGMKLKNEADLLQSQIYQLESALTDYSNLQFKLKHLVTTNVMSDQYAYLKELDDILNEQIDDEVADADDHAYAMTMQGAPTNDHVEFQIESESINDLWNDGDEDPAGGHGPNSHI